jgi:hypothetical protein
VRMCAFTVLNYLSVFGKIVTVAALGLGGSGPPICGVLGQHGTHAIIQSRRSH